MKIRNGFVSNSSSSSFLIYGTLLDSYDFEIPEEPDELKEFIKSLSGIEEKWNVWYNHMVENYPDTYDKKSFDEWLVERIDYWGDDYDYYFGEEILGLYGFEQHRPYDDIYIGSSPENMNDDETMGEWKKNIEERLKKIFGEDTKIGWLEEAWMDG